MSTSATEDRNSRLGIRLFLLYAVFYLAFVLVNAFAPEMGERKVVGGLNLSILWGFALIGVAFVLAMIYGFLCNKDIAPAASDKPAESQE